MKLNNQDSTTNISFTKSKEKQKDLTLAIIGLVVQLSPTLSARLGFIGRILKKEPKELKSFCTELGLHMEEKKEKDKITGKLVNDWVIFFHKPKAAKVAALKAEGKEVEAEDKDEKKQE